ncbi:MAG: J domain-containing protein [Xanthomonadaceae bacterium]|nr:J domain-containing protein [Xanthomonadaceae bacterium]
MRTHWAFDALGLTPDADERAIKRAYAAKLKTTRPDEDPEGFQALNDAYRAALGWRAMRAHGDAHATAARIDRREIAEPAASIGHQIEPTESTGSTDPVDPDAPIEPPATTQVAEPPVFRALFQAPALSPLPGLSLPTAPMRPAPFDAAAFFDELLDRSGRMQIEDFRRWLNEHEALYSVELKDALDAPLVAFLDRSRPMRKKHLDETLRFFGLDTVSAKTLRLEQPLHRIRLSARRHEESWDQIMSRDRSKDPSTPVAPVAPTNRSSSFPIWPIILLCVLLSRCAQQMQT